jgi:hypothetical protein
VLFSAADAIVPVGLLDRSARLQLHLLQRITPPGARLAPYWSSTVVFFAYTGIIFSPLTHIVDQEMGMRFI